MSDLLIIISIIFILGGFFGWAFQMGRSENPIIKKLKNMKKERDKYYNNYCAAIGELLYLRKECEILDKAVSESKAIRDAIMKELEAKENAAETISNILNKEKVELAISLNPATIDLYEEEIDN